MKYKLLFVAFTLLILKGRSQTSTLSDPAVAIAKRMKDTLSLSERQMQLIYNINMQIQLQKMRYQQPVPATQMQLIENNRDTLYRTVLPDSVFIRYKQKRLQLISAN